MAEKVMMIALSPTMEDGQIVTWNKKEGDTVDTGDVLCEVETDKATMDYESTQEGTILKIIVDEGGSAKVGQTIAIIGEAGEDTADIEADAKNESGTSVREGDQGGGAAPGAGPKPGETATGVASQSGPRQESTNQPPVSPGTQAPSAPREAAGLGAVPTGGVGGGNAAAPGSGSGAATEAAGQPPTGVPGYGGPGVQLGPSPGPGGAAGAARGESGIVKASPLARRIAEQRGIDLSQVGGTGPEGRIVKRDVESFQAPAAGTAASAGVGLAAGAGRAPGAAAAPTYQPAAAMAPGQDQEIAVGQRRAVIARRLAESKFSAPHYYLKTSVRMDEAIQARSMLNKEAPEKVGFNAFFIKYAAEAIKRHPNINASWQGDSIIQYGSIDIGLAVDVGNGLITPIVRNCGNRGVVDIDRDLKQLIDKVRNNALKPEEYTGATFTISNLGSFGVEEFTAIINPPGSAILALGQTKKVPVVGESGELEAADVMKMTLSCDHRVIDGAAGGRFLYELQRIMENPVRVLF